MRAINLRGHSPCINSLFGAMETPPKIGRRGINEISKLSLVATSVSAAAAAAVPTATALPTATGGMSSAAAAPTVRATTAAAPTVRATTTAAAVGGHPAATTIG